MTDQVRIIEVGPRDGLQNERIPIPVDAKLRFVSKLLNAGIHEIEVTSFVSPKWVPQLGDAQILWPQLPPGGLYSALIPNIKGLERALEVGVERIALFTAASESFTQKNINMSIAQSLETFGEVIAQFRAAKPQGWVRGYVSTAFECPYEGRISPERTCDVARRLIELGVDEVSIGDTIGVAAPDEVRALTKRLIDVLPVERLTYHFHDTYGCAIANVAEALELGVASFDSSAGGLGGCPYAPGATGNLATEDLVYFLRRSGVAISPDLVRLSQATLEILQILGRQPTAKAQVAQLAASETCPT